MSDRALFATTLQSSLAGIQTPGIVVYYHDGSTTFGLDVDGSHVQLSDDGPASEIAFLVELPDGSRQTVAYDVDQMPRFNGDHEAALAHLAENPLSWARDAVDIAKDLARGIEAA